MDDEDAGGPHRTTAEDLARILRYCMMQSPKKEAFLQITGTQSYGFTDQAGKRKFTVNNHNAFLNMMDGALTGKTGFTNKAGYCYVGALEREGKTYIAALLACGWPNHKTYKWSDMKKMMTYGLEHYAFYRFDEVPLDSRIWESIPVKGGKGRVPGEVVDLEVKREEGSESNGRPEGILLKEGETIEVVYTKERNLEAPVQAGEPVGSIRYCIGNETYKTSLLVARNSVERVDFPWCLQQSFFCYLL